MWSCANHIPLVQSNLGSSWRFHTCWVVYSCCNHSQKPVPLRLTPFHQNESINFVAATGLFRSYSEFHGTIIYQVLFKILHDAPNFFIQHVNCSRKTKMHRRNRCECEIKGNLIWASFNKREWILLKHFLYAKVMNGQGSQQTYIRTKFILPKTKVVERFLNKTGHTVVKMDAPWFKSMLSHSYLMSSVAFGIWKRWIKRRKRKSLN